VPTHALDAVRPLLKWAGGKRQLLPQLRPYYPDHFTRYVEPFFGSGAVFFDLLNAGRLHGRQAIVSDVNPDLIGCYLAVRDHVEEVIQALEALAREHARRDKELYYEVRDRFNGLRAAGLRGLYTPTMAAMLIYLNRTGFNGLFRQNRDGMFNVPAGRYLNPRICDRDHLRSVAQAWQQRGVTMRLASFEATLAQAGRGDFVYCDPPYAPLSRTASFAHYTAGGFTGVDQMRLQEAVIMAARRGAMVLVSNSSAPDILTGYSTPLAMKAGLVVRHVSARRAINSDAGKRGSIDELVITNAPALKMRMAKARLKAREKTA
jgi:DNA adenine methylase